MSLGESWEHGRIRFSIENFRREDVFLYVAGRCCLGPITIGDVFSEIEVHKPFTLEDYERPVEILVTRPTSLQLVEIVAYGRNFALLNVGMTAELKLEGAAGEIEVGEYLGGILTATSLDQTEPLLSDVRTVEC